MLTDTDWAGSGRRMYEAIKLHTNHDIEYYSRLDSGNIFSIKRGGTPLTPNNVKEVQERINQSDIIHLKGDWPAVVLESTYGLKIRHRPVVQTVSGGFFRKKNTPIKGIGKGRYKPELYKDCALRTSFEPDLMYDEYQPCVLTPYPIDCLSLPNEWEQTDPPTFTHFPSDPRRKGTKFLTQVFNELSKDVEFKVVVPKKRVSHKEAMSLRMGSTIYFDQFVVGAYGNAAVEMMQYGIPVAAWIPDWATGRSNGAMDGHPIITADLDISSWVDAIKEELKDLPALSVKTKEWCDNKHSYQAIAKLWDGLYESTI